MERRKGIEQWMKKNELKMNGWRSAQQHRLNGMYDGIYKKEQVEEQMKEQLE